MQNNPNRNEAKFIKVKEQMENAKRTYEVLNSELHDELPALHDSRILFLVTNMQTLFAAEEVFHSETAKVGKKNKKPPPFYLRNVISVVIYHSFYL